MTNKTTRESKPDNYRPDLHDQSYRRRLREAAVISSSLINDSGRQRESLDGFWKFSPDPYDTCLRARWWAEETHDESGRRYPWDYDYADWETVTVPSCWNMISEKYFLYEGPAVYTRSFTFRTDPNMRTWLRFGAAYHDIAVFLNRKFIGFHEGGDTPFNWEITDDIEVENIIVCVVNNARRQDRIPTDVTDWFNYGGLYRSVDLLSLPRTFLKDWQIYLLPNSGFEKIRAIVDVDGPGVDFARLEIPELGIDIEIKLTEGHGEITINAVPELWCPENPRLYHVILSAGDDTVSEAIGFREIVVNGMDILLNGVPIYLNGVSCHEESVTGGKTLTESEVRENLSLVKELGGNFIRLAHYPHHERTARIADEIGLMIWSEIPVYWSVDFTNTYTVQNGLNQLEEMIRRDRNRASVIIWSVGNENPDTDERLSFMTGLVDKARQMDSTRLVSAACLWDEVNCRIQDRLTRYLDVI
ncbi:MAG: glycoside hydrolase family 2 TIM barrel-domain containing protein, partial [Spirochaetaceae bacterium]|nr:glycoside hydrolase family 2 TIM barrel-domain containing protein [Spirochaetaceae bacterium]